MATRIKTEAAVPTSLFLSKLLTIKRAHEPSQHDGSMDDSVEAFPGTVSTWSRGNVCDKMKRCASSSTSLATALEVHPRNRAAFGLSHESKLFEPAHVEIRVVAIQVVKT
jgi:hypothetical protein